MLIVGAGLAGGLLALALLRARPGLRMLGLERGRRLGAEHTWCFHAADVPAGAEDLVEPLVEFRWDGYDVRFPGLARNVPSAYRGLSSAHYERVLERRFAAAPAARWARSTGVAQVAHDHVTLTSGDVLHAPLVIDARGPDPPRSTLGRAGYQKFVGLELQTARPHGLARPLVMDALVDQTEGYRFFYVLPLAPDRLLVEDTRFADTAELNEPHLRAEVLDYAAAHGWSDARVLRAERGVLPMTWSGTQGGAAPEADAALAVGYRGGWRTAHAKRVEPAAGGGRFRFEDLPAGEIAVSLFHDVNDDGELNTGVLGIPTEPWGVSRDARGTFGPPKYGKAVLELQPDETLAIAVELED